MRLVPKLSLVFLLCSTVILGANGWLRVRREVGLLEADRIHDHDLIGRALAASVAAVWRSDGEEQAMHLIEVAGAGEGKVHIRWVWLDGRRDARDLHVDLASIAATPAGTTFTRLAPDSRGDVERYTYAPLAVPGGQGALELSEPLETERASAERIVSDTVRTMAVLAITTTLLSYVLGSYFVGRPVRALVGKARRIGQGDFGDPVRLSSRDELAELGREMNATSDALVAAHDRVARETAARIGALEQLRHADRLTTVGKLASGVAHELGTPLNVVAARADMIRTGDASAEEARAYATVIVDASRKMTRIIRQLLEFARRRGPRKEKGDVAVIAERTLDLLRPLAERQHVSLSLLVPDGRHDAPVDAAQIEQALTNLVVNAVQATPSDPGGVVEVSVKLEHAVPPADHEGAEGDWIAVRVRDRGEGIAPENLAHVFEPFFTTKDVGSGTGLGLSVAYGIVSDHGGWMTVESQPGQGSTFALFLPAGSA
jgi:two-component system NtrC family sensor kinase